MSDPDPIVAARSAIVAGQRNVARGLLAQIVRADMSNGEAWHLLGQVVDDPAQKAECAKRAQAAGYLVQSRRIVFPLEEAPEPAQPAAPASSPAAQASTAISAEASTDLDELRSTLTPVAPSRSLVTPSEEPSRQAHWRLPALAIILLVLVIAVILLVVLR